MTNFLLVKLVKCLKRKTFHVRLLICCVIVAFLLIFSITDSNSFQISWKESIEREFGQSDINADMLDELFLSDIAYEVDSLGVPVVSDQSCLLTDSMEIIRPNGGETLAGNITIQWTAAFEGLGEVRQYSVYYSPDHGDHWIQIAFYIEETRFTWDSVLYGAHGSNYLIKVVAYSKIWGIEEDISDGTFNIHNKDEKPFDLPFQISDLFIALIALSAIGSVYFLYNALFKKQEPLARFMEPLPSNGIEFMKTMHYKVIIGLDNITDEFISESREITRLDRAPSRDFETMIDCFPESIQDDLRSEMKGRTVLALIEIAFQNPGETSPTKLSKSLDIPLSTLSKELKKLIDLQYIETYVSAQVLNDGRYRNFAITPKGFTFLSILKDALKITISMAKEKPMAKKAYWDI